MHGVIEFGNRLLTGVVGIAVIWLVIAARNLPPRYRSVKRWAWAQMVVIVLNAVVGGITVWARLSPFIVAAHFIAATLLVAAATITIDKLPPTQQTTTVATAEKPMHATWAIRFLVASTYIVIIAGTFVTGAGPHAGDSAEVDRMPIDWTLITSLHAAAAVIAFCTAVYLQKATRTSAPQTRRRITFFIGIFLAQGAIGTLQSLISLPEALVALHILGAVLVWIGAIRVATSVDLPR